MKSIRDYINLVSEKADPSRPASMKTVNGQNIFTNDPDPANAVKTGSGGTLRTSDGKAVTSGTPAPAADAAAAAKAKLTPSQLKWLGGADPTDPHIMARMPKPKPGEQVPGTQSGQAAQPSQIGGALNPGIAPIGANGRPMRPVPLEEPAAQTAQTFPVAPQPQITSTSTQSNFGSVDDSEMGGYATQAAQATPPSSPPPGSVDDEGNLMPGFTKDENGNVVSAGDPNFVEPATQAQATADFTAAKKKEVDKGLAAQGLSGNAVNAQGQATGLDVSDETGTVNPNVKKNSETGELYSTAPAAAQSGQAAQPATAAAAPAQPANRDAMPFGKAFADAKAKGEKEFTWKGKKYAVKMATTPQAPKTGTPPASGQGAQPAAKSLPGKAPVDAGQISDTPMAESTGYSELQRILSIVNYR